MVQIDLNNDVMSRYKICQLDPCIINSMRHGPDMSVRPLSIARGQRFDPGIEEHAQMLYLIIFHLQRDTGTNIKTEGKLLLLKMVGNR